jgi:tetratricopeptide (TPR) repeat protein
MKKNRIVFLPVPESLRQQLANEPQQGGRLVIDPDIPLPVEIPEGSEKASLECLSVEAILSAMLLVIKTGKEKREWIDYYRGFVLVLRPDILAEFTEAAVIKARNGDFGTALEILDVLEGLFPASPAAGLNRALVLEEQAALYRKSGRKDEAKAVIAAAAAYEKLLKQHPLFPPALFNGACFFFSQNDFQTAAQCFSRYIEIEEDGEKRKQAEKTLKEITDKGLNDEDFIKAYKLIREGEAGEGLYAIRSFLERRPMIWNGWFVLGWALRLLGRFSDAIPAFRKAIELGGTGDTRNELAICLMETGNLLEARQELEAALSEDPENVKIISNLGVLAMKNGEKERAAAFFRTVLELDPDDPVAKFFFEA